MRLPQNGANQPIRTIINIGPSGFWVLVDEKEYFVPYDDYPRFLDAPVAQIFNLHVEGSGQLHWPDLEVDIEGDALEFPEKYPLRYR